MKERTPQFVDTVGVTARIDEEVNVKSGVRRCCMQGTTAQDSIYLGKQSFNRMTREWEGENWLRTEQISPALAIHPRTIQEIWLRSICLISQAWKESPAMPSCADMEKADWSKFLVRL